MGFITSTNRILSDSTSSDIHAQLLNIASHTNQTIAQFTSTDHGHCTYDDSQHCDDINPVKNPRTDRDGAVTTRSLKSLAERAMKKPRDRPKCGM